MASNDDIQLKILASVNEAIEGIEDLEDSISDTSKASESMATSIKKAFSTLTLKAKQLSKLADYTDSLTTSQRLLSNAFDTTRGKADSYISTMTDMLGTNETAMNKQVALFGQLANSIGLAEPETEKLAEGLTTISSKLALLYNTDFEDMSGRVRKAISGSQMSLKSATGIAINENNMLATMVASGIDKQVSSLNTAEKSIVRYATLTRMVTQDMGAYSEAVNSVAWQKQILASQINRVATAFGNVLYPVIQKVLPVLNGILMVVVELINVIAKLFGYTGNLSKSTSSSAQSFGNLAGNIGETAKATEKATKQLRGFDKLNNITTPTPSSGSSTPSSGSGLSVDPSIASMLDEANNKMLELENNATKVRDAIMNWLGFTKNANGEWEWSADLLKNNILKTVEKIKDFLVEHWKQIALIGGAIAGVIGLFKLITGFGTGETKTMKNLSGAVNNMSKALVLIAGLVGLAMVVEAVAHLIQVANEGGMSAQEVLELLAGSLIAISVALMVLVGLANSMDWEAMAGLLVMAGSMVAILLSLSVLIEAIANTGMSMETIFGGLAGIMTVMIASMTAIVKLAQVLSKDPTALVGVLAVTGAIIAILLVLKATLPTILDTIGDFINTVAGALIDIIEAITDNITKLLKVLSVTLPPIVNSVGTLFEKIFNGIKGVIEAIGKSLTSILNSLRRLVVDVLNAVLNFIDQIGPAIENSINAIIRSVTNLINFFVSGIEYLINRIIIDPINALLRGLSGVKEALKKVGINLNTTPLSKVSIPRFSGYEDGGFPNTADLFWANENGKPEYIGSMNGRTAVANNDQIVEGIRQGTFNGMMSALSHQDFDTNVTIQADGDIDGLMQFIEFRKIQQDRQYAN